MLNIKKLLTKLLTGLAGKVSKSGDTMTGRLTSKNSLDTTTGTAGWYIAWQGTDKNDLEMGQLMPTIDSAGNSGLTLEGVRVINGTSKYNSLRLYLNRNGEPVVGISSPTAWVNALGVNAITNNSEAPSSALASLPNNAWRSVGSISFPAGTWLLIVNVQFQTNANGIREIFLSTNNASDTTGLVNLVGDDTRAAVSGRTTYCRIVTVLSVTTTTTYYIKAHQNSGSTLSIAPRFSAVKLKQ